MAWVKRPASEPVSQIGPRHDEEIGTPTEVEQVSGVDITEDTPDGSKVWKDSLGQGEFGV